MILSPYVLEICTEIFIGEVIRFLILPSKKLHGIYEGKGGSIGKRLQVTWG